MTRDLAEALSRRFYPSFREFMLVLPLDSRFKVMGWYAAGVGAGTQVSMTPQEVFRVLVPLPSRAFLMVHNHPSGDPDPSQADVALTKHFSSGAALLGLQLLDHLVIGRNGTYVSLAERGLL